MNKIKEIRVANNMTQLQLANAMNCARSTIAMWENGKSAPDPDSLVKLSAILNVSVDYLLGIDDEEPPKAEEIDEDLKKILDIYAKLTPEEKVIFKNMLNAVFAHRQ